MTTRAAVASVLLLLVPCVFAIGEKDKANEEEQMKVEVDLSTLDKVLDLEDLRLNLGAEVGARTGVTAQQRFCRCSGDIPKYKSLCNSILTQCSDTFCKPICLSMAWQPQIEVHCERAPQWSWCEDFKLEVEEAMEAVTTQFQAHTCLQMKFCNRSRAFVDWVENHSFGDEYPNHKLPIHGCTHEDKEKNPKIAEALCGACEKVIDVSIKRGNCIPGNNMESSQVLQGNTLEERCRYMADAIQDRAVEILKDFRAAICPCLGCCGDGLCYFPNVEKQWLGSLIQTVQAQVSRQLEIDGWNLEDNF